MERLEIVRQHRCRANPDYACPVANKIAGPSSIGSCQAHKSHAQAQTAGIAALPNSYYGGCQGVVQDVPSGSLGKTIQAICYRAVILYGIKEGALHPVE